MAFSATTFATNSERFGVIRKPHGIRGFTLIIRRVENKGHTNAHLSLTSLSAIGATIPASPPFV